MKRKHESIINFTCRTHTFLHIGISDLNYICYIYWNIKKKYKQCETASAIANIYIPKHRQTDKSFSQILKK